MPNVTLPLPETYMSISRPTVLAVCRNLIAITSIPKDVSMRFAGHDETMPMYNGTIHEASKDTALFRNKDKFEVIVTERPEEDNLLTLPINNVESRMIFTDPALDITMVPRYSRTEVSIDIVYTTNDLREAEAWLDNLRLKIAENRESHTHHAEYHYGIPKEYVVILTELHRLRENKGGYGNTVGQWLADNWSKKVSVSSTMDGRHLGFTVEERQENIQGWFEFTGVSEKSRRGDGSQWQVSFAYKFFYDKPFELNFRYPYIIHNQLISAKFREVEPLEDYWTMQGDKGLLNQGLDYFRRLDAQYFTPPIINVPNFDSWEPQRKPYATCPVLAALICIDEDDLQNVMSLMSFSQYRFTDVFIAYLKQHYTQIKTPGAFPIWVGLYSDDGVWIHEDYIEIDEDLNVRTTFDLDIRRTYHVVVGVVTDLSILSPKALNNLLQAPEACLNLLSILDSSLEQKGLLPAVIGGVRIPKEGFWKAMAAIKSSHPNYRNKPTLSYSLVGKFVVVIKRA